MFGSQVDSWCCLGRIDATTSLARQLNGLDADRTVMVTDADLSALVGSSFPNSVILVFTQFRPAWRDSCAGRVG